MMDEAAVELIRRAYAAWNDDDWVTMAALADPHIEWRPALGTALEGSTKYFGVEGVRAYRDEVQSLLGTVDSEMSEILRATPEHVLVRSHVKTKGAASGILVEQHFVHAWTIRGGRIVAMRSFPTETEALAAVGLASEARRPPPSRVSAPPRRGEAARARPDA
jgi:ketosteroid isomerase-like protein